MSGNRPGSLTLTEYVEVLNKQQERDERMLNEQTRLRPLEELGVHLLHIFGTGQVVVPNNDAGSVLLALIVKLTNELFAFCGCMRAAALLGSYHHLRVLLELRAALHYLFGEVKDTPKRVSQFLEFERMAPWQRYRTLELARDKGLREPASRGSITQDEFVRVNLVSQDRIAHATPDQIKIWMALWGFTNPDKLARDQQHWHEGGIRTLMLSLDPTGGQYRSYEVLCHATHISPLGHRLIGGPMQLLGFTDLSATSAVNSMCGSVWFALKTINGVLDGALDYLLADAVSALQFDTPGDQPIAVIPTPPTVSPLRPARPTREPRSFYRERQRARLLRARLRQRA